MTKAAAAPLPDLWNDAHAADLDEPGLLLYRSNLLGSDLRITNFGGGNTSAKLTMTDPLTQQPVTVLWVKGSGGDLGSMKRDGFSTLYLDKLESLKTRWWRCSITAPSISTRARPPSTPPCTASYRTPMSIISMPMR
jgi:hypothetical protein